MEETVLDETSKPLIGTEEATMDSKFRILLSSKKQRRLGKKFTLVLGKRGCLFAYPEREWLKILAEVKAAPETNEGRQRFTRLVVGNSEDELDFDEQGRLVVPQRLRKAANLTSKVMLVGCIERLEIWDKAHYDAYIERIEGEFPDVGDAINQARREMNAG